jgi:U3 small nucleolar RNA-associated protein 11
VIVIILLKMSTLKGYIPKRKYRERSQLKRREKLGILEKKKDYKVRADNYHKKKNLLSKLINQKNLDFAHFSILLHFVLVLMTY